MAIIVTNAFTTPPHGAQPGRSVEEVSIDRGSLRLGLLTLGAAIHSVEVPDAVGNLGSVHLRLPNLADYADHALNPHLGATVGRYANRIGDARFTLDGQQYHLDANRPPHTLHGGEWGFDRLVWSLTQASSAPGQPDRVTFTLHSADGDMGFPGNLTATVTYEVTDHAIAIHYRAVTDKPTVVSLTNHGYWNLSGAETVDDHLLAVAAERLVAIGDDLIPTGGFLEVDGTALDLRTPRRIGDVLRAVPSGLDHCYVLVDDLGAAHTDASPHPVAVLSGGDRWMSVVSDCPGVQVYSGNALRAPFAVHGSVSLETQRLPDAPNHPGFGACVLRPDDEYRSTTVLTFGVGEPPECSDLSGPVVT